MHTPVFGLLVCLLLGALGVRILLRSRASGTPTEGLVGIYFVGIGLGSVPALLAGNPQLFSGTSSRVAMAFGHLVLSLGFGALYLFVWRCFGTHSLVRRSAALGGCAVLALLYVIQAVAENFVPPGGAVVRVTAVVRAGALIWALGESLRYWLMMRRRVELGLTDAVIANRFLLWCLWMGGMLGAIGVVILTRFLEIDIGPEAALAPRLMIVGSTLGLALLGGLSLWFAFFPPHWYAERLHARRS
ncbi:MAG: hypothetical protein JRG92_10650 [Deltaproteobacteria bacterium]|nr:hypothetical protein [Deltaproteobacteria bacterium]